MIALADAAMPAMIFASGDKMILALILKADSADYSPLILMPAVTPSPNADGYYVLPHAGYFSKLTVPALFSAGRHLS